MILRKISESVRLQNWFTVVIELVIVGVGVFLGLQAQEWSISKVARADEVSALSALRADLAADLVVIDSTLTRNHEEQDARELLSRYASDPDSTLSLNRLASLMYLGFWRYSPYDVTQPTLDELKTSGKLNQLGSSALRRKIQEYFIKLAAHRRSQDNLVHIVFSLADPFIVKEYEMSSFLKSGRVDVREIGSWFDKVSTEDSVRALKSREFRNILAQLAVATRDVIVDLERVLAVHNALIVLVDQRLDDLGVEREAPKISTMPDVIQ